MKDYYKILEIEENATDDDIKKSYRALSKKYHPDVNPEGEEKFKEIAEAYEVLGNKVKREQYINSKRNPFNGGGSFEDIINQMFNGGQPNRPRRKSAPDKVVKIQISPVESYLGSEKKIQYLKDNHCQACNGVGGEQQSCSSCKGAGFQIKTFGTGFMVQQMRVACGGCGGRGYTLVHRCYNCDGRGVKPMTNEVKVTLPVGIDSGQYLKLDSLGDFRNGEYGDLVVQVEMVNQDGFEKINNDLIYNLFLNLEQIQQEKFVVPHPNGELTLSSPASVDTSRPLRLKGKGFNGGDMYVKLNIRFERTT
jgi:molecular chaperone DnaJ